MLVFKVKLDTSGVIKALRDYSRNIDTDYGDAVLNVHKDVIEPAVQKAIFTTTDKTKSHYAAWAGIRNDINCNIFSKFMRGANKLNIGTGEISYMDRKDPILNLDRDLKGKSGLPVRLWRILNWGVKGKYEIAARGKGFLTFFWTKIGRWMRLKKVNHPGQKGKFYFNKAVQEAGYTVSGKYGKLIRRIYFRYMKRYSGK